MANVQVGKIAVTTGGTWNASTAYRVITIVTSADGAASYISKQDVPAGTPLTNTTYWQKIVETTGGGGGGTSDHTQLTNRDAANQHPISAINGLQTALDGKGTYTKPSGGIPKSDLASAVQTSLGLADSALQTHQSLAAYRTSSAQDVIDAKKEPNHGHPYALDGANLKEIFGGANALYAALEDEDYSRIHNLDYYPIKFQGTYRDYGEWMVLAGTNYYSDTACKNIAGQVESDMVVTGEDASPAYYRVTIGGTRRYVRMRDCQRWREKTINMTAKMEANINAYWGYGDSGNLSTGVPHIMWLARDGIALLRFRSSNLQWADAAEQFATGDGSTTVYTPDDAALKCVRYVCVNGVLQTYNTAYTVNADTGVVTFKSGHIPESGADIIISRTTHNFTWIGSAIHQTINDPNYGLIRLIDDEEFAAHIYSGTDSGGMRYAAETRMVTNETNVAWSDRGKMFLPTETEIFDEWIYSVRDNWTFMPQLPVFANGGRRRMAKAATDGGTSERWAFASSANATNIVSVDSNGRPITSSAKNGIAAVPGMVGV